MFEDLFEYQKSDVELLKIENMLKSSNEYKLYLSNYKAYDDAKKLLQRLEADAQAMVASQKKLEEMSAEVEKLVASLADIKSAIENEDEVEDINEIDYYKDSLDKVVSVVESYEKEMRATQSKINDIKKKYSETLQVYKKAQLGGKEASAKYQALKDSVAEQEKALKEVLSKSESVLKEKYPEVMAVYLRCRGEKKLPAVVEKNGDYCGACGVQIDAGMIGKLKNSGNFAECQNCHKIIVVK